MFKHPLIDHYAFPDVPLDRDLFLMSEIWLSEYDRYLLEIFDKKSAEPPGFIGGVVARGVRDELLDLVWYPNWFTRLHRVEVPLPHSQFVCCVGSSQWDEKPHIFVKDAWLKDLHTRPHCVFGLVDAIGVKAALAGERIDRSRVQFLRKELDAIAADFPGTNFFRSPTL